MHYDFIVSVYDVAEKWTPALTDRKAVCKWRYSSTDFLEHPAVCSTLHAHTQTHVHIQC